MGRGSKKTIFLVTVVIVFSIIFWITFLYPHPPDHVTIARVFHIIAHRGASAAAPENTLVAFLKAVESGADMLELDVRQTRDSQLVVLHDGSVERTTNGSGNVDEMLFADLRRLEAGSWYSKQFAGVKVPSLREIFDSISPPTSFLIELKKGSFVYPGIERRVIGLIQERRLEQRVILKSFDDAILDSFRIIAKQIPRLKIFVTEIPFFSIVIEHGIQMGTVLDDSVQYLEHHWFGLSENFVTRAHEHGYGIFAWDVNDEERMKELIDMGVDGIETDHPEQLRSIVGGH